MSWSLSCCWFLHEMSNCSSISCWNDYVFSIKMCWHLCFVSVEYYVWVYFWVLCCVPLKQCLFAKTTLSWLLKLYSESWKPVVCILLCISFSELFWVFHYLVFPYMVRDSFLFFFWDSFLKANFTVQNLKPLMNILTSVILKSVRLSWTSNGFFLNSQMLL